MGKLYNNQGLISPIKAAKPYSAETPLRKGEEVI